MFAPRGRVTGIGEQIVVAIASKRRPALFDLWAVASKGQMGEADMRELAGRVLPG